LNSDMAVDDRINLNSTAFFRFKYIIIFDLLQMFFGIKFLMDMDLNYDQKIK
jgi:hypothetical protein